MKLKAVITIGIIALQAMAFTTNKSAEFKVDKEKSKITWIGKKVTGQHTGNINITEGKLLYNDKAITGGTFTIDMNSITNTDLTDAGYNQKLVGHLKSDDFFGVEKFPTATLVITKAVSSGKDLYKVTGNLTIKGITKVIEFPANIEVTGGLIIAKAKIVVDRSKYDVKYGSNSFFDNLGDKAIDNAFELNVSLIANKQALVN